MKELLLAEFKDIPSYIFFGSVLFLSLVSLWAITFYKDNKDKRILCISVSFLVSYIFLMFCSTVIFRDSHIGLGKTVLIPGQKYMDIFSGKDPMDKWEVILNIALFIPIGSLLSSITRSIRKGRLGIILSISIILSVITESLQYFFQRGFCEIDDVIHNTLGCLIGYGLFKCLRNYKLR